MKPKEKDMSPHGNENRLWNYIRHDDRSGLQSIAHLRFIICTGRVRVQHSTAHAYAAHTTMKDTHRQPDLNGKSCSIKNSYQKLIHN